VGCLRAGARYLICPAFPSASIVSSTDMRTVVSIELSAPPLPMASATAAIATSSGASQSVCPSCSPNAYQNPCSFPPTDSMYSWAVGRRSSGFWISRAHAFWG
jgi:hypothetical protein